VPLRKRTIKRRAAITGEEMLALVIGPRITYTDEPIEWTRKRAEDALREPWMFHAAELLEACQPGSRPWAYWRFDLGEENPPADGAEGARRLATLGLLSSTEVARLRAGASFGGPYLETWKAVAAALKRKGKA
jgi:hypothetical protein